MWYFSFTVGVVGFEPDFLYPLENVTIAQGRDATFTCVVNNLGGHTVSGDTATARVCIFLIYLSHGLSRNMTGKIENSPIVGCPFCTDTALALWAILEVPEGLFHKVVEVHHKRRRLCYSSFFVETILATLSSHYHLIRIYSTNYALLVTKPTT